MTRNSSGATSGIVIALTSLLLVAGSVLAAMDDAPTNIIQRADEQAVIALERSGQLDQAEARCVEMLKQNPNDSDAKRLLAEIKDVKHKRTSSTALRETLEETIIPEVNFREARVADVIEFLRTESQKISGAENPINFVWEAPEDFKSVKVTLSLRQVPLADALKYVTVLCGLRYRVDPHAVVVYQAAPPVQTDFFPSNAKSP